MTTNFVPLNANRHRYLKLMQHQGYRYAREFGQSALLLAEFGRASVHCPIVFVGHSSGVVSPVVLLAREGVSNAFVSSDGQWIGSFIPLAIRLHPFAVANVPERETPLVCIDTHSELLSFDTGVPLFDMNGDPTPALDHAKDQLNEVDIMLKATENFCRMLHTLHLLAPYTVVDKHGNPLSGLENCYQIDPQALDKLGDAALCVLRKEGWLAPIYAHRISLMQLDSLPASELTRELVQQASFQQRGLHA
jgi:hypothetical protein